MNARFATCALAATLAASACSEPVDRVTVEVAFPDSVGAQPLDGRLILVLSANPDGEPRTQVTYGPGAQPIFGLEVEGWEPGATATFTDTVGPSPTPSDTTAETKQRSALASTCGRGIESSQRSTVRTWPLVWYVAPCSTTRRCARS